MYNLCLLKDNKKLILMSSKSQKDIDDFTINFDDEQDFLWNYDLDDSYKVVVEKETKEGIKKVPFLSYKYHNLLSSFDNFYYFLQVTNYDREVLENYFDYESLRYENVKDNKYLNNKLRLLNLILKNINDKEYSQRKLAELMRLYFDGLYSNFKDFYITLVIDGFNPKVKEYESPDFDNNFDMVEEKIKNGKYKEIPVQKIELDDSIDEINFINSRDMDIDEKVKEVDMMTDSYKFNKKMKLINNMVVMKNE